MAFSLVLLGILTASTLCYSRPENRPSVLEAGNSPAFEHVYGGSKKSPLLHALRRQNEADHFRNLQKWFDGISIIRRRVKSNASECTLRGHPWVKAGEEYVKHRNLGKISSACPTRTKHYDNVNETLAFHLLEHSSEIFLPAAVEAIGKDANLSDVWKEAAVKPDKTHWYMNKSDQRCTLNHLTAIRVRKMWYIAAAASSMGSSSFGERLRIVEYVPSNINSERMESIPMVLLPFNANGLENGKRERFSTSISVTRSSPISGIYLMKLDDNGALKSALDWNELRVDLANDSITKENILVLIFPVFIPYFLVSIAERRRPVVIFMALLTNVFAVLPFIIKGVELVLTSTSEERSSETWVLGEEDGVQIAETWTAACQPVEKFRNIGTGFIVLGIASVLAPILIELRTREWMSRRRHVD